MRLEFKVSAIQARLQRDYHRRKPPIGVRRVIPAHVRPEFTREDLEHLVALFADANDPVSRAIADKALAMLEAGR